jgi:hypothetical protein
MYGDVWKWAGEFRKTNKKYWNKMDTSYRLELKYQLMTPNTDWKPDLFLRMKLQLDSNIELQFIVSLPMVMGDIQGWLIS